MFIRRGDFIICLYEISFLSERRDKSAALSFFRKAIRENKIPSKVVVDKIGSNKAALDALNTELDQGHKIQIFKNKYLNNRVEQDHRFSKKRIKPILGFKSFHAANITITRIENIRIIQKGQLIGTKKQVSTFDNFSKLMAA